MEPGPHAPDPREDDPGASTERVLVRAGVAGEALDDRSAPALGRTPPLPTLHLAPHEIVRFPPPRRTAGPA